MDPKSIREKHQLSQSEMAVLLGVSVSNITNWESGRRSAKGATETLYLLVETEDKQDILPLVRIACARKYMSLKEAVAAVRLSQKLCSGVISSMLQISVAEHNRQYSYEDLGIRTSV